MKKRDEVADILRDALVDTLADGMRATDTPPVRRASIAPSTVYTVSNRTKSNPDKPITARPVGYCHESVAPGCYRRLPTCRE